MQDPLSCHFQLSAGGGRSPQVPRLIRPVYVLTVPTAKPQNEAAIRAVLSAPRSATYVTATGNDTSRAVDLYGWNARVSSALMLPSHFAEVATRNAVADALTAVYGPNWPWDSTFERSLPSRHRGYNPQRDLRETRRREPTTGKVIAELKFAFWQEMFAARHAVRIWDHQILTLFPHATGMSARQLRDRIYNDLNVIRKLRNRVAHHEPIFTRNLDDDLVRILELVELRCTDTASWVFSMEDASQVLSERP